MNDVSRIKPIGPPAVRIEGAAPLRRTVHQDARGFLLETLRSDDAIVNGDRFRMSYTSLTIPGQFRDADRWHVHRVQTDRFVVLLGEMTLALFDARRGSLTEGLLDVVRLEGVPPAHLTNPSPRDFPTYLLPIPPGVYHSLGNLSNEPFLYQNYPTELYDASDEGRVSFSSQTVAALGGPFSWESVARPAAPA
jgi:dTDP-4-dehydrorhamnose 3,5-epimerase-like enzyme